MGEESVILCRDRAGEVHVFLNSCRHRGMKVCRYDEGNTTVFTCPYHGWSYGTDGRWSACRISARPIIRRSTDRNGASSRSRSCATTRARSGPPGTHGAALPGISRRLHALSRSELDGWDGREGQAEVLGGVQKWLVPCNWKFPAENFSGDTYHNISHRSVDLAGIGPSGAAGATTASSPRPQAACRDPRSRPPDDRLCAAARHRRRPAYQHSPIVAEYFRHCEEERRRRPGDKARLIGAPGEIFPNTALLSRQPRTIAVWHPRGAHQTECGAGSSSTATRRRRSRILARLLHPLLRARPA